MKQQRELWFFSRFQQEVIRRRPYHIQAPPRSNLMPGPMLSYRPKETPKKLTSEHGRGQEHRADVLTTIRIARQLTISSQPHLRSFSSQLTSGVRIISKKTPSSCFSGQAIEDTQRSLRIVQASSLFLSVEIIQGHLTSRCDTWGPNHLYSRS